MSTLVSLEKLYFSGASAHPWRARGTLTQLLRVDLDSLGSARFSVKSDKLFLLAIRVALRGPLLLLVNKDLAPKRILAYLQLLLRLE